MNNLKQEDKRMLYFSLLLLGFLGGWFGIPLLVILIVWFMPGWEYVRTYVITTAVFLAILVVEYVYQRGKPPKPGAWTERQKKIAGGWVGFWAIAASCAYGYFTGPAQRSVALKVQTPILAFEACLLIWLLYVTLRKPRAS